MKSSPRVAAPTEFETSGGNLVDLIAPSLDDISFRAIVLSLASTNRFNGHVGVYTTAQHSVFVASLLPEEHRVHGLVHDFPEYVLGDITSPVKTTLTRLCPGFRPALKAIENAQFEAIYRKAGIPLPTAEVLALVKRADLIALATEQRDVVRSPNVWNLPFPPSERRLVAVDARSSFLMLEDALDEVGIRLDPPRALDA